MMLKLQPYRLSIPKQNHHNNNSNTNNDHNNNPNNKRKKKENNANVGFIITPTPHQAGKLPKGTWITAVSKLGSASSPPMPEICQVSYYRGLRSYQHHFAVPHYITLYRLSLSLYVFTYIYIYIYIFFFYVPYRLNYSLGLCTVLYRCLVPRPTLNEP